MSSPPEKAMEAIHSLYLLGHRDPRSQRRGKDSVLPYIRPCLLTFPFSSSPLELLQVFRQNKRATDVHDIIGFRIVISPEKAPRARSPSRAIRTTLSSKIRVTEATVSTIKDASGASVPRADATGARPAMLGQRTRMKIKDDNLNEEEKGQRLKNQQQQQQQLRMNSSISTTEVSARSVYTVKTFPPPYRDADSQLLHDVYEVLVNLFEEVPGRYKVRKPARLLLTILPDVVLVLVLVVVLLLCCAIEIVLGNVVQPWPVCWTRCVFSTIFALCPPFPLFRRGHQNYVDFPKANGYRSVHTTVLHASGLKMEFQVQSYCWHVKSFPDILITSVNFPFTSGTAV